MSDINPTKLGKAVTKYRQRLGISASELARRTGLNTATITRTELGEITQAKIETVHVLAQSLGIPLTELLTESKIIDGQDFPAMTPYLRTKYKDLPPEAIREIEAHFETIATKHGITGFDGPAPGDDE